MIVEMLLGLLKRLLDILLTFEIPQLPEQAMSYIDTLFDYMVMGASILANYTPLGYMMTLFGLVLIVDGAIMVYHFVMWILRKIPVLGIS